MLQKIHQGHLKWCCLGDKNFFRIRKEQQLEIDYFSTIHLVQGMQTVNINNFLTSLSYFYNLVLFILFRRVIFKALRLMRKPFQDDKEKQYLSLAAQMA